MNLLGLDIYQNLRLLSRNEGKIKTYESCTDVRAWSHDSWTRDRYLREWIKRDMPICVLPGYTLSSFLRTMTCRSRAKATPRCHPDCKSKVLLESICVSCHAIKECLKHKPKFDKYFAEEEFETSHWPCDKCLDVLKSIKLFWKIIVEKVFGISISKIDSVDSVADRCTDNVKSVAKIWEKELVQQAMFVKNVTPLLSRGINNIKSETVWQPCNRKETSTRIPRPCNIEKSKDLLSSRIHKVRSPTNSIPSQRSRASDIGRYSGSNRNVEKPSRKLHRCTSIRVRMVDEASETTDVEKEREDIKSYMKNIDVLQQKCNVQETELEELRNENNSLKIELQNFYKTCTWESAVLSPPILNYDKTAVVPKPFESCVEGTESVIKNTDSEMIITMKNCRNESFKHVSLLQVLHKTNESIMSIVHAPGSKKENPIDLLHKVQNTFGEIVRREIMLINNKKYSSKHSDINASFFSFKLKKSRSAPSCTTVCSDSASTESNFISV